MDEASAPRPTALALGAAAGVALTLPLPPLAAGGAAAVAGWVLDPLLRLRAVGAGPAPAAGRFAGRLRRAEELSPGVAAALCGPALLTALHRLDPTLAAASAVLVAGQTAILLGSAPLLTRAMARERAALARAERRFAVRWPPGGPGPDADLADRLLVAAAGRHCRRRLALSRTRAAALAAVRGGGPLLIGVLAARGRPAGSVAMDVVGAQLLCAVLLAHGTAAVTALGATAAHRATGPGPRPAPDDGPDDRPGSGPAAGTGTAGPRLGPEPGTLHWRG